MIEVKIPDTKERARIFINGDTIFAEASLNDKSMKLELTKVPPIFKPTAYLKSLIYRQSSVERKWKVIDYANAGYVPTNWEFDEFDDDTYPLLIFPSIQVILPGICFYSNIKNKSMQLTPDVELMNKKNTISWFKKFLKHLEAELNNI